MATLMDFLSERMSDLCSVIEGRRDCPDLALETEMF
jgi:hypothetical protein